VAKNKIHLLKIILKSKTINLLFFRIFNYFFLFFYFFVFLIIYLFIRIFNFFKKFIYSYF
jgi:hypothetical protein